MRIMTSNTFRIPNYLSDCNVTTDSLVKGHQFFNCLSFGTVHHKIVTVKVVNELITFNAWGYPNKKQIQFTMTFLACHLNKLTLYNM